ncbi:MAG: TolC family protein [Planctomycetota bacterium]
MFVLTRVKIPICRRITLRGVSLLAAGVAVPLLAACSSMRTIDKRIDRILDERSSELNSPGPEVGSPEVDTGRRDRQVDKNPGSRSPAADSLLFEASDAERSVEERLDSFYAESSEDLTVGLEDVFRLAQESGREYRTAEEDYIFAVIRLLIERHRWTPRFFDDLTVSTDWNSIDGSTTTTLNVINELRVTQLLPYGGDFEARLVTAAAQDIVNALDDPYTASTQLVLSADIPLLRDAGLIAQEDRIQAERNVVYAARAFERFRRSFLVDIAGDYFGLIAQQANILNQQRRLENLMRLERQRRMEVDAGRRSPFELANVEQNVARSRVSLANSRDSYRLATERFQVRLGLDVARALQIRPVDLVLPEPEVGTAQASRTALLYRLDYQNQRDRLDDSRRGVINSRNQLLPDLDVFADATFGTDNQDLIPEFDIDDSDYRLGVTFGLPLDREIERLTLRQSIIGLQRAQRDLDEFRDNVILDARASVREIERAKFNLDLQERAVELNRRRLDQQEIDPASVTTQESLDAQDELLQSLNDRNGALRDLRIAVLDYLLATGQMRVDPTGLFRPLQGMLVETEEFTLGSGEMVDESEEGAAGEPSPDEDADQE